MVVTARAPTSIASIMQEATGAPSSQTVQAEQAPRSQPILVPVRSSGPRSTSARVVRGWTCRWWCLPLTVSVSGAAPGPAIGGGSAAAAGCASGRRAAPPTATLAPVRKERRETRGVMAGDVRLGSDMNISHVDRRLASRSVCRAGDV